MLFITILLRCTERTGIVDTLQGCECLDVVENLLSCVEVNLRVRALRRIGVVVLSLRALKVGEEEELILHQRSAERSTEGVVGQRTVLGRSAAVVELVLV